MTLRLSYQSTQSSEFYEFHIRALALAVLVITSPFNPAKGGVSDTREKMGPSFPHDRVLVRQCIVSAGHGVGRILGK